MGLILIAVALLILISGGVFVVVGPKSEKPVETEPATEIVVDKGKGGIVDDLGAEENSSNATLIVKPAGGSTVLIRGKGGIDYQYTWNGKGNMVLENAPAGLYQTRFENFCEAIAKYSD